MHTKPSTPVDPNDKYEKSDISLAGASKMMAGLFAMGIFSYFVSYGYLKLLGSDAGGLYFGQATTFPVRTQDYGTRKVPPAPYPLLQDSTTAMSDMRNYRRKERQKLDASGTDAVTGKRFISVGEAIELESAKNGG